MWFFCISLSNKTKYKIMKLELKHLAGYLPYGLKYKWSDSVYYYEHCSSRDFDYENSKPILRPLSDLTKEIDVNGEKFVPIKELKKLGSIAKKIDYYYYSQINKMLEWHFDIHGLIEAGLAIDINTLNK